MNDVTKLKLQLKVAKDALSSIGKNMMINKHITQINTLIGEIDLLSNEYMTNGGNENSNHYTLVIIHLKRMKENLILSTQDVFMTEQEAKNKIHALEMEILNKMTN